MRSGDGWPFEDRYGDTYRPPTWDQVKRAAAQAGCVVVTAELLHELTTTNARLRRENEELRTALHSHKKRRWNL